MAGSMVTDGDHTPADEADSGPQRRQLFSAPIGFMLGAVSVSSLPPADVPEIAFAGRSNVGKSSLINAFTGRKALARTSNTPGRTREINFFDCSGRIRIVDLPGYGYASAPKDVVKRWTGLIRDYLRGRANLARVFVLTDARHGLKPGDLEILDMLDQAAVSYQLVLTKIDKLKSDQLERRMADTKTAIAKRPAAFPELLATSSAKGVGLEALQDAVVALALPAASD
ncbi:MAG: ribosome biogenesis GTP-binding protein YihA/YsxC [Pseudomonadota bacterium]